MPEGFPLADELAAVYARMSGLLLSEETVQTALGLVTALAKDTIPGTVGAGVTLIDERGHKTSAAASDSIVERADALQYELDEGPCLSAWAHRSLFRIDDIPDPRWPEWSAAVAPLFIRSTLSVPLLAGDIALGAVKVYSEQPNVFTDREERLLTQFAAQASIPLANMQSLEKAQQLSAGLKEALNSRQVIGQAMGILMAPGGIDEAAAFAQLVDISQRQNKKLRDVAQDLVRSTVRRRR